MVASAPSPRPEGKCPVCGRPTEPSYRPFCSRRCADVDLARWLRGAYAIPDAESEDSDGREGPPDTPAATDDPNGKA